MLWVVFCDGAGGLDAGVACVMYGDGVGGRSGRQDPEPEMLRGGVWSRAAAAGRLRRGYCGVLPCCMVGVRGGDVWCVAHAVCMDACRGVSCVFVIMVCRVFALFGVRCGVRVLTRRRRHRDERAFPPVPGRAAPLRNDAHVRERVAPS